MGRNNRKKREQQKQQEDNQIKKKQDRLTKRELKRQRRAYGDADWKSDFLKFEIQLESIGLGIKDVAGDGNCLFRAISDQLDGTPNRHAYYRAQICSFLERNREEYQYFVEDDMSFDEYIREMKKSGTWGGQMEITACCLQFEVNITVHRLSEPRWDTVYSGTWRTLHISYHDGDHYNSVRLKSEVSSDSPPSPFVLQDSNTGSVGESTGGGITSEEQEVMDSTGCPNLEFIRQVLIDNWSDVSAACDFIWSVGAFDTDFQTEYINEAKEAQTISNTDHIETYIHPKIAKFYVDEAQMSNRERQLTKRNRESASSGNQSSDIIQVKDNLGSLQI
eukprot:TRINITY_DN4858_c0_g3_i1.p1 TRINITY_DN4858_c0_g3~~TRINITY_DN4858_c0_g3_i1.p1  ORF type:complete len:334 (-),score=71.20 TRINITY_DN4858_c0_g3_i1:3-1004(-)